MEGVVEGEALVLGPLWSRKEREGVGAQKGSAQEGETARRNSTRRPQREKTERILERERENRAKFWAGLAKG